MSPHLVPRARDADAKRHIGRREICMAAITHQSAHTGVRARDRAADDDAVHGDAGATDVAHRARCTCPRTARRRDADGGEAEVLNDGAASGLCEPQSCSGLPTFPSRRDPLTSRRSPDRRASRPLARRGTGRVRVRIVPIGPQYHELGWTPCDDVRT